MKPKLRDTENVFLLWINVDIVGRAGKSRRLDEGPERSRVVALDIALESRAKAFDLSEISGELSTTAADVDRVTSNEFLLSRIFQVLPARHPGNCGISNVVRRRRLAQKPRQVAISRASVEVIAKVPPQLSARIGDSRGPVCGLGIQHDVRSFDAGCSQHDYLGVNFHFSFGRTVDIRHTLRHAALVNNYTSHQ